MICFMFPGQPLSMGGLPVDDPEFQAIASLCAFRTSFDPLSGVMGDMEGSDSIRLQLFGICMSLWKERSLAVQGISPAIVAEHSMGIYPALAACGVISAGEALEMGWRVGKMMAGMAEPGTYSLGCITGLTAPVLESIARNHDAYIANYNTSRHFLIAGLRDSVEAAVTEAEASGAFSVSSFLCDAPLHTPLMEEIAGGLREIFADYRYRNPATPLMEHISQKLLDESRIPGFLLEELTRPVYWEATYRALKTSGVTRSVEVGAGQALTKFNRWIESET